MDMSNDHRFSHSQYAKQLGSPSPSRPEPMIMGSPSSPHPGSHNTSQYLPGFLFGDQTSGSNIAQSPLPAGRGLWPASSGSASGSGLPRFSSQGSVQSPNVFGPSKNFVDRAEDNMTPIRSKDKVSAPPVSGLLDTSISTPSQHLLHHSFHTSSILENLDSKNHLAAGYSSPLPYNEQHNLSLTQISHSTPAVTAAASSSHHHTLNFSQAALLSPPQLDPFYTQGEELSPHDSLDETWVTVFGFSQGAAGHILQLFNEYGTILEHKISNEGNWMYIHYKTKIAAKKALSKNGKVIGNNMMVGVRQCIDQSVMRGDSVSAKCEDDDNITLHSVQHTIPPKTLGSLYEPSSTGTPSKLGTPIRSLTKAYHSKPTADVTQTNSSTNEESWWKRAMEYAFGW